MNRRVLWTSLGLLAWLWVAPALTDEPLSPPADFVHETSAATVRGNVAKNSTTITQHGVPGSPSWSIPVWARFYSLSPDALSILVLNPGGNLLSSTDPKQTVMTVWYLDDSTVRQRGFALAEVMNPSDMPRTVGHYLWMNGYSPGESGWLVTLADGRKITVTYR